MMAKWVANVREFLFALLVTSTLVGLLTSGALALSAKQVEGQSTRVCGTFVQAQEPTERFTGLQGGDRYKPAVAGGDRGPFLAVVDVDYGRRQWIIVTQDNQRFVQPFQQGDPAGFAATFHRQDDGRLFLKVAGNQYLTREIFFRNTGIEFVEREC